MALLSLRLLSQRRLLLALGIRPQLNHCLKFVRETAQECVAQELLRHRKAVDSFEKEREFNADEGQGDEQMEEFNGQWHKASAVYE